jgi:transposase-like protein
MSIMETMERKQPRARRSFTAEFKAEIVELYWLPSGRVAGSSS